MDDAGPHNGASLTSTLKTAFAGVIEMIADVYRARTSDGCATASPDATSAPIEWPTAIGEDMPRLSQDLNGLTARYRSVLAGRRVLLLLDNARDADQVRPLLSGSPGCMVLVTSRDHMSS